jgi:hypothetical protein
MSKGTLRYPDGRTRAFDILPSALDVPEGTLATVIEVGEREGRVTQYEVTYLRLTHWTSWQEQTRRRVSRCE